MGTDRATRVAVATHRLFFAIVPPPPVALQLEGYARQLHADCSGRVVPAVRIHMTIAFLGATSADRIEGIVAAANLVRATGFRLQLDRTGWFRKTRVAWIGCADGAAPDRVAVLLRERLSAAGCALEARAFVPHVTLLRDVRSAVPSGVSMSVNWDVDAFLLMESVHRAGRLEYHPVARFPLRDPSASL